MSLCMISAITRARRWDDDGRRVFWKFSGGAKANATRGAQHLRELNCHEPEAPRVHYYYKESSRLCLV